MKIIFINKNGKNLIIKDKLEKMGFENIEVTEKLKSKINKSDTVITTCFKQEYDEYQKVQHLIIVTQETNPKEIYKMVSRLNVEDIIRLNTNYEYISKRIKRAIIK